MTVRREALEAELRGWWAEVAATESDRVVAKAIEYGATDLVDLGHLLLRMGHRAGTDQEAAELGVLFYLAGKLSRWSAAVAEGRPVSLDTIEDIGVYCRMAQRIRSHGGWPGVSAHRGGRSPEPSPSRSLPPWAVDWSGEQS